MRVERTKKILISLLGVLMLLTITPSMGLAQTPLTSGVPVTGSVGLKVMNYYQISTSATDTELKVTLTGLSADIDLYVKAGSLPTTSVYDCRSWASGTTPETCTFANPGAKNWYIGI